MNVPSGSTSNVSQNPFGNIECKPVTCHVTHGLDKHVISCNNVDLMNEIKKQFKIEDGNIVLQMFNPSWNDWCNISLADVKDRSKLNIILAVEKCEPGFSRAKAALVSPAENPEPSTRSKENAVASDSSEALSVKHFSVLTQISAEFIEELQVQDTMSKQTEKELANKMFHLISKDRVFQSVDENTFYPTRVDLIPFVKTLLREFPLLKGENYNKSKMRWIHIVLREFAKFRCKIFKKEKKGVEKEDKSMQTENRFTFQDLSPVVESLKQEHMKKNPDLNKIRQLMLLTFQYRRSFIINSVPKVVAIQELYPSLFDCEEVRKEFRRITGKEDNDMFFRNVESYSRIIFKLVKHCSVKEIITSSVKAVKQENLVYNWKNAGLLLLPYLFNEDLSFCWFSNRRFDGDQMEPYIKCNATLSEVSRGNGCFQVYAESILLAETTDLTIAMECFLASYFIFLIEYRMDCKKMLQILQSFFYEYDDPCEEDIHKDVVEVAHVLKAELQKRS